MGKMLGIAIVMGVSSLGGFLLGERLAERCRMLRLWLRILELLKTEIFYHNFRLPEILMRIASTVRERTVASGFEQMAQRIAYGSECGVQEAWEALIEESGHRFLSRDDCEALTVLGYYLGNTDREDQAQKIASTRSWLEANLSEAELVAGKRIRLYRYLGFATGAMVVLLMI